MPFKFMPDTVNSFEKWLWPGVGKQLVLLLAMLIVSLPTVAGCAREAAVLDEKAQMPLSLSSSAFKEGDKIPVKYTCDGEDVSPPLIWGEPPQKTQAFALIVDDPDAPSGIFTHWVLFNIPANVRELEENVPARERLENGILQGKNDFGRIGYSGPCPPRGPAHRYRFTVYALDKPLDLKPGASRKQLLDTTKGHVLAQGQLMGIYQR